MSEPSEDDVARLEGSTDADLAPAGSRSIAPLENASNEQLRETAAKQEMGDEGVAEALDRARLAQLQQANTLRDAFFTWVSRLVTACIIAGILVIGAYLWSQWGHLDSRVILGWFGAEVVQTIGLAYIVAKYLFPSPQAHENAPAAP